MDVTAGRWLGGERPIRHLDPTLMITALGLGIYGLLMIYSATHQSQAAFGQDTGLFMKKQLAFLMLGLIALVVMASFDYRLVKVYATVTFVGMMLLLFLVLTPLGSRAAGAQRWITLFGFQFQPSEFAKIGLVAMLAAYLSEFRRLELDHVWRATAIAGAPLVLVFFQPDVGTSMAFAAILIGLLVVAGAKGRHLGFLTLVALFAVFAAFRVGVVQQYQIDRLTTFLAPAAADPLHAGYNVQQSTIAIGAGGITGKGYLRGTQTSLDFVPHQQTDFVFTVVGEEFGFVGALFLLLMYGVLLWRGLRIAMLSRDPFGTLLAAGIVTMLAFQVFVNIGMTLGIMPMTGIPLPLVSYGGSALIANFMAVGLLMNVHMRRFK
jgi:rod shape determining protein RodA